MQGKISELKKRQEALRKGLENLAKEKQVQNTAIVKSIDVNTMQLDSSNIKDLINNIMPQDDVEEGFNGTKGPDQEADSNSAQVTLPAESEYDLLAEEGCSGATGQDEEAESDSAQEVTLPAESESDLSSEKGCSAATGQDEDAKSDQEDIPTSDGDIDLCDPSEEHGSGNDHRSEYSSNEGEQNPSRKRVKMD